MCSTHGVMGNVYKIIVGIYERKGSFYRFRSREVIILK
jgi:hypothetical protein